MLEHYGNELAIKKTSARELRQTRNMQRPNGKSARVYLRAQSSNTPAHARHGLLIAEPHDCWLECRENPAHPRVPCLRVCRAGVRCSNSSPDRIPTAGCTLSEPPQKWTSSTLIFRSNEISFKFFTTGNWIFECLKICSASPRINDRI